MKENFKIGDIIICVINSKASLTLFKDYKVLRVVYDEISIINDNMEEFYYNPIRFIQKSKMREILIDKIINN